MTEAIPKPIFDTLEHLREDHASLKTLPSHAKKDFPLALDFLKQYDGSKATFESYRREVERVMQWAALKANKSLLSFKRIDIEDYIAFCMNPPKNWIGTKRVARFKAKEGLRVVNPDWRPFVVSVSKMEHKHGVKPDKNNYQLSQKAVQEIFTVLSSFYQYLLLEEKITVNPIALIRQKSKYIRKQQTKAIVPRLSEIQWEYCIRIAEKLAEKNPLTHERTLFILSAFYLMYLRISELISSDRWEPQMGHFYQDENKCWWFMTVGKGNKERHIPVSDDMLKALKRYRKSRSLMTELPTPAETTPLIHKLKGKGAMSSDRPIRALIQKCFDEAVIQLKKQKKEEDANALEQATVHWLRHTGISDDINKRHRPVAHVRDDAGHSSSATTDRYNNIEREQRHESARNKKVKQ